MHPSIRNPRDFWAGILYVVVGTAAVVIARDYSMGSAGRMGPAYFPSILGGLLALFGLVSFLRSLVVHGHAVGHRPWRPLTLVTLSVVLFALLLEGAGLVVALGVLLAVSAGASRQARFSRLGAGAAAVLIAFCSPVFVKGLGLPFPLLGSWFGG